MFLSLGNCSLCVIVSALEVFSSPHGISTCVYNSYLAKDLGDPMQSSSSAFPLPACSVLSVLVVLTLQISISDSNSVRLLPLLASLPFKKFGF